MVALFAYGAGRVGKERDTAAEANRQPESVARGGLPKVPFVAQQHVAAVEGHEVEFHYDQIEVSHNGLYEQINCCRSRDWQIEYHPVQPERCRIVSFCHLL